MPSNIRSGIKSRRATSTTLFWYGEFVTRNVQESITDSLLQVARECVRAAKHRAPYKTGRLKGSIRINRSSLSKSRLNPKVRVAIEQAANLMPGRRIAKHIERRISWGSYGVPYAIPQEYGTGKIRAKRYLRGAAEEVYPKFMSFLEKEYRTREMNTPGRSARYSHPGQYFKLPEKVLGF